VCINGSSGSASIAESFRVHLASVYGDAVDEVNVDKFYDLYINYKLTSTLQEKDHLVDIQLIKEAVKNLKFHKAVGHDGIVT